MIARKQRLSRTTIAGYAIGSLGTGGFATLPGLILIFYLTDTLGVLPLMAGIMVGVAKLWDVIIDPVIGYYSDRQLAVSGSRRGFMLLGGATLPLFFIALFATPEPLSPLASGFWVLITFLAAVTAFSLFQVPYLALPAELTRDYDERTRLLTWRVVVLAFAIMLFGAGAPPLRALGGGSAYLGYLIMGAVAGIVLGLGLVVSSLVAPRQPLADSPAPRAGFSLWRYYRSGFQALRDSQSFRALLCAFMLQALANGEMLAAASYVATWVLHDPGALSFLFIALIGPALVVTPLWGVLSRRIGKERAYLYASMLYGIGAFSMIMLLWTPGPWVYISVAACGAGYAGMQSLPLAMLPDVISHDARHMGTERAGTFSGLWTAGETIGLALGATVLSIVLAGAGYVAHTANVQVDQPATAITGIVVSFSVVPAAFILCSVVPLMRYRLRKEDIDDYQSE